MKKKHVLLIGILIPGLIVAFTMYNYMFNSEHRDIESEEATVQISAIELNNKFENNEENATAMYLDRVIEVSGSITSFDDNSIVLNDDVEVRFTNKLTSKHRQGDVVVAKGRCVGYDELLELVKIDQSILIKK